MNAWKTAALAALAVAGTGAMAQVKIGVLTDMSSAYSDFAGKGSVVAVKMAVEDFGGKVLGQNIDVAFADHQNKADIGAAIARRWYDAEGVDMITDLTNSAVAIAVQDITRERRKINLTTSTGTTVITNARCSPYGVHWTIDSYGMAAGPARTIVQQSGKKWFFITADFTFGHDLEATATKVVQQNGGTVAGRARHPVNSADFSSYLLQAQASGADVLGLATAGTDLSALVKQANEFRITRNMKVPMLFAFITDIHSIGLENAKGFNVMTAFYWDRDAESRAWSERFYKLHGAMPTEMHAGAYSATMHYLKAVQAAGTKDSDAVMRKMRETPVNDFAWKNGRIRPDGRMVHDMYLAQVKTPAESKRPWDYYRIVATVPAEQAFIPLADSTCPLVKK